MIILSKLLSEATGRTRGISEEQFLDLYNDRFLAYRPTVYRGLPHSYEFDFGLVRPSQFERESAHTQNYYTYVLDNSPRWSEYPDRSRSLICASDYNTAESYGQVYIVFFEHGSTLGIAPSYDIWHSINTIFKYGFDRLDQFNEFLKYLVGLYSGYKSESIQLKDPTYQEFKSIINMVGSDEQFFDDLLFDKVEIPTHGFSEQTGRHFAEDYLDFNGSLYQFLEHLLDPKRNNFKTETVQPDLKLPSPREVWSDGDALLLRYPLYKELENRL